VYILIQNSLGQHNTLIRDLRADATGSNEMRPSIFVNTQVSHVRISDAAVQVWIHYRRKAIAAVDYNGTGLP
jgi:hypothetical protein